MSINAGTIAAYLTLDTNKFTSALSSARSQLKTLKDDGASFSDKMTAVGGAFTTVGTSMTKNWTVSLLSAGISAGTFAVKFEDAFAGVRKTVDATEEEYEQLSDSIMEMAAEMPTAAESISGVMEAAGQLGIQKENLEGFTEVMVQLGDTTNLSADTAATTLARFANITGMSQENFDRLGSTIVDLGNNFATTEAEISDMALRIAGAGKQVGMSEADIMGVAAALSSVGLESEAGGTAVSKVLTDMSLAVEKGVSSSNEDLQNFAKVAGMSSEEFVAAFKEDAAGALSLFIQGLGSLEENGGSAISVLDEMGITEVRMRDALLRSSGAADTFTSALETASTAWEENTALTTEAEKRYETTASQIKILWNRIKALGVQFGEILIPYLKKGIDHVGKLVGWFSDLDDGTKKFIITAALIAASIGPIVTGVGRLYTAIGTAKTAISAFNLTCLSNPYVAIAAAIVVVTTALIGLASSTNSIVNPTIENFNSNLEGAMVKASEFISGIDSATGALSSMDEKLYSEDNQSAITSGIEKVQSKITAITDLASRERRNLTKKEIKLLEKYYEELNALTERQYSMYEDKLLALEVLIEQEETMSYDRAQSYLADAYDIKEESIALANESYAEQVAIAARGYASLDDFYANASESELARLEEAQRIRDERISIAEEQYGGILTAVTGKTTELKMLEDSWLQNSIDYSNAVVAAKEKYNARVAEIQAEYEADMAAAGRNMQEQTLAHEKYTKRLAEVREEYLNSTSTYDLIKSFSEIEEADLGMWLALVSQANIYGAELDSETHAALDGVLAAFQNLRPDAKESMKNTWLGMKEELAAANPELYAAAESDANSIINAIDAALGIASPSRVMRERGKYTMQGLKEGMTDERSNLISNVGDIIDEIRKRAEKLNLESAGTNAMDGLQRGMNKKKSSLLATAGSIATSIASKIRSALDIHSPSRVMEAIGLQIPAGLAVGMEDYAFEVRDAAENLATIASTTVSSSARNNIASGVGAVSKTNDAESKLDKVINLLELLLVKEGDVVLDGRVMGRWIKTLS